MDKKDFKKNFRFSLNKITKIYLPIVLTIFIVFNIPFFPNAIGSNTNLSFQPASASGESYFFSETYFKNSNRNKKSNNNGDINITIWIIFLMFCFILGFIYFIFNGFKNDDEQEKQSSQDKSDYIQLLKDDSDFEGNI